MINFKELNAKVLNKPWKNAVAGGLVAAMLVGGVGAYFTDTQTKTNTFTVGKVAIELTEPNYDDETVPEDENDDIVPTQEIKKDPTVTNVGKNDAYVYIEVTIPRAKVVTANADGTKNAQAVTDLFTYTVNEGWTMLAESQSDTEVTRVYYYNGGTKDDLTDDALEPEDKTPALFDSVTFANIVEGQGLEETTLNIDVVAKAIQVTNAGENATEAYQIHLAQNK